MPRISRSLTPPLAKLAAGLGQRIELARARRDLSATLFAERVGIDPKTLARLEAGDPNVSLGSYLKALRVLRLEGDIEQVASQDTLGLKLQDARSLQARGRKGSSGAA
ncbi:MAG: helix-turn-helix transcriptional regulator [Burkholderiales bacterium]|jgi:transcriptional regulator with XRE-family HTH domain|nr:helix-turn-helix transcriptional regulator [Burkholderiales bacterium]